MELKNEQERTSIFTEIKMDQYFINTIYGTEILLGARLDDLAPTAATIVTLISDYKTSGSLNTLVYFSQKNIIIL